MTIEPLTPERRRQQTRDFLLRAAAQVFSQRGFHGASLDEVAAVAGFTKGAVYSNFKNKEDLFLALLESIFDEELAQVRATLEPGGPPEAHLSDFVNYIRGQYEAQGEEWVNWIALREEFLVYAMRNAAARQKLAAFSELDVSSVAEIIEAERARHGIKADEPARHAARFVVAVMNGVSVMRALDPAVVDQAFLESMMTFIARALVPPPAEDSSDS
ncbi:MAG TPA: TetR/AcrR family transcriptional regulator [Acidimicrobiales bacterium]|nr:TetR/AcrR family transcriptional regulator [Acidimicrobiales bacterium]